MYVWFEALYKSPHEKYEPVSKPMAKSFLNGIKYFRLK